MVRYPESVVVVKYPSGYAAYLYFANERDNIILSAVSRNGIMHIVESYLKRKQKYYAKV